MRLYDFSRYARRRDESRAAHAVVEVVEHLNAPGAVIELKARVHDWYKLHREIISRKVG